MKRTSYLCICRPSTVTALGILSAVWTSLQKLGIHTISGEQYIKLVGIGNDGTATNITGAGLKELIKKELPWILGHPLIFMMNIHSNSEFIPILTL